MEEQKLLKRKKKAISDNNKTLLITTCINLAEYYFTKCKYEAAIAEYKIVAEEYKKMNDFIAHARCNRMIGEAYTHLRQYSKALKYQNIHLKIAVEKKDKLEEQRALATIGHTYLTKYEDMSDLSALRLANKSFKDSLEVCEKLESISQREHMDMTARLFANIGLVEEYFGNYEKGIQLVQKSIDICKRHNIFEQLERGYRALGSIYNQIGDYKNAMHQYNLALEVASRLEDKSALTSDILAAKGEIFIKLFDFHNAKNILLKAYKLRRKDRMDLENIEQTLRVVAVMCYTEDHLLNVPEDDYKTKKELYEKMGDGASNLKIFLKAIEYYENMLQAAIDNNDSKDNMGPCYFSLAQTYFDAKRYDKALEFFEKYYQICRNNIKESTSILLTIAEIMDLIDKNSNEIENRYEQALLLCKEAGDSNLHRKIVRKYMIFLQKYNLNAKIKQYEGELNACQNISSDTESDTTDIQTTSNIGEDINIDDITDVSDEETLVSNTTRKRTRVSVVKKNSKGETQLHLACISGNSMLVRQLLERGHPVNIRDNCGWLPLHEACNHGYLDVVKILVENGAAINDRGGTKCEGITPLHDAAINGHLDIVEYLIESGASIIAKSDDGKTPFHCFKEWREKAESVDPVTETHYDSINKQMLDVLKRSGHYKDNVSLGNGNNASVTVISESGTSSNKRKKNVNYSLTSSDEEEMDADNASSDESASDVEVSVRKTGATKEYQEVMTNLRHRSLDIKRKARSYEGPAKKPALLESDETGDQWLDDDLGRIKKRRTFNNALTSTFGVKNANSSRTSIDEPVKDYGLAKFHSFNDRKTLKENHEPSRFTSKRKKRQTSLINAGFITERSISPISYNQPTVSRSQHPQQSKHRQIKLTNFCDDERVIEPDSTTQSPASQKHLIDGSSTTTNIKRKTKEDLEDTLLSVDVRINGKLYRVPIPYGLRNTLTIKWLADEAAKRFCRKEYMKPILELETKNGALLAEDDLVGILFPLDATQSDEVNATVVKWNVPPLIERYREACNIMNIGENSLLVQVLSEASAVLDLSDNNFGCKIMKPFCKAINRQTNLHHLNLSGNFILDECLELLSSSLISLENLTVLNLSMSQISSDGLHHIANIFSNQSEKSVLENLVVLDLSYNPLGNGSLKHLAIITRHLKLRTLKLMDVDFTSEIFDDFSNRNLELYLDYIEELNISENRLDKDDILRFIQWIRPTNLQILDISNNTITEHGLVVEIVRIFEANSATFWKFKYLNFSRCKVTDAEVYELLRLLSALEHSLTLNLSYNENLSSISLRRLLQEESSIKTIWLEGCSQVLQYFETAGENTWKLNENSNLKNLRISIDKERYKLEYNALVKIWKNRHWECSVVNTTDNFLSLSIE